jgi:hypothetical protein
MKKRSNPSQGAHQRPAKRKKGSENPRQQQGPQAKPKPQRQKAPLQKQNKQNPEPKPSKGHKIIASHYDDSGEQSNDLFEWLISPVSASEYREQYWEKQHLHIERHKDEVRMREPKKLNLQPDYYKGWFHMLDIKRILLEEDVRYTRDIDVTNYIDGQRVTLNPAPLSTKEGTFSHGPPFFSLLPSPSSLLPSPSPSPLPSPISFPLLLTPVLGSPRTRRGSRVRKGRQQVDLAEI